MIDSIIFDLDGTLWDSTKQIAASWNRTVEKELGYNPGYSANGLKPYFGKVMSDIATGLFPTLSVEKRTALMNLCALEENEYLLDNPGILYPYLEHTLAKLSGRYDLFIVSNCQSGYIEAFLEISGLSLYFKDHLCPGDTGRPKAFNIAAIKSKHQLHAPVYVGDTEGDRSACLACDIPFVYASYGFGSPKSFIAKIADLSQLPDTIEHLSQSHI